MSLITEENKKSLKFKISMYFCLLAVIIMSLLWILQIFFLDTYYENKKTSELQSAAVKIEKGLKKDHSSEHVSELIGEITMKTDLYVYLEHNSELLFSAGTESPRMPSRETIMSLKIIWQQIRPGEGGILQQPVTTSEKENNKVRVYASKLELDGGETANLMILSPLTPLSSTVSILRSQLILVTIIALLLGVLMSLAVSRRLTKPLEDISDEAAVLATGNYNVHFDGGSYTEVNELADTLNFAAAELSKSDALRMDLIANVSHDLKTPLTMIKSYAEMVRDLSWQNEQKRNMHLDVIISEADRLNDLVNEMTVLSKMQSGVESLEVSEFDLREVAEDLVNRFSFFPEADSVSLELDAPDHAFVKADERKITQALYNLIGNAVKYSSMPADDETDAEAHPDADEKEKSTVIVKISEMNMAEPAKSSGGRRIRGVRIRQNPHNEPSKGVPMFLCEVADNGPGIPEDEQEAVWERYYRASSNRSRGKKGSGLGLSIVKEIMKLHSAPFGLRSRVGEGSTFYFLLPKA